MPTFFFPLIHPRGTRSFLQPLFPDSLCCALSPTDKEPKITCVPMVRLLQCASYSIWGGSSVGRASRSQRGGQGFESPSLHHPSKDVPINRPRQCASAFCFMLLFSKGLHEEQEVGWKAVEGRCEDKKCPKRVSARGIALETGVSSPSGHFPRITLHYYRDVSDFRKRA